MAIQCNLQRLNADTGQWETIQSRSNYTGGVIVDHFFDKGVPTRWGGASYRITVRDEAGNALGVTTLLGVGFAR